VTGTQTLHCLVLDGVYRTNAKGEPEFVETPAPSEERVWEVLERIIKRVMKQRVRRGFLVEDQGETYLADADDDSEEARTLRPPHRGSCAYRIAFGPRAGQKVLMLQGEMPRELGGKQKLCANLQGFSLHAAVRDGAVNYGPDRERPWSGYAATSPGQRSPMTGCRSMLQAKSS
jgi:Putative transposase